MVVKSLKKCGWINAVMISAIVMIAIACGMNVYHNDNSNLHEGTNSEVIESFALVNKEIEIEYGKSLPMNLRDYVKDCSEEVFNALRMDLYRVMENGTSIEKIEFNNETLDVGKYYIVFTHNTEKKEVKVHVVDSQAPVIILKKNEVELEYGEKWNSHDYVESVEDMVEGDLEYTVEGDVNTKKAGTYVVNYKAVDKNGLLSTEKINVVVRDKKVISNNDKSQHKEDVINLEDEKNDPDYDVKAGSSGEKKEDSINEKVVLKPWTVDEVPTERKGDGNIAFATKDEALNWANKQINDENSQWYGTKYMVSQIQKYGQKRLPNDPWAVTFIPVN